MGYATPWTPSLSGERGAVGARRICAELLLRVTGDSAQTGSHIQYTTMLEGFFVSIIVQILDYINSTEYFNSFALE